MFVPAAYTNNEVLQILTNTAIDTTNWKVFVVLRVEQKYLKKVKDTWDRLRNLVNSLLENVRAKKVVANPQV